MKKIDETGDVALKEGSGQYRPVRREENIKLVEEIIPSQEDTPGTHSTPSEIAREFNIDCRLVSRRIGLCPLRKLRVQKLTDSKIEKCMTLSRKFFSKYT